MNRDRYLSVRYLSVFVAAAALIPTKVTAETPGCPSSPCHVELNFIEIDYPVERESSPVEPSTKIMFTLQTKDDTWALAASDDSGSSDGKFKQHYFRLDGKLRLVYSSRQAPDSNRIALDETLHMIRSKKGPSFLSPVFKLGSSGSFTTNGILFAYESEPWGCMGRISGPASLSLTYPENASLASIEVFNQQGKVKEATPCVKRKGKGGLKFPLYLNNEDNDEPVWVAIRLSEADEKLDIPLKKEITLNSFSGREKIDNHRAAFWADMESRLANLAQPASAASDVAEVRLKSLSLYSPSFGHVVSIKLKVKHLQGKMVSLSEMQPVLACDSEGNKMWGICPGADLSDPSGNEDGTLDVRVSFNRFPKGEWIQLDSSLRLFQVDASRTLEPQTIPLRQIGVLDLDGLQLKYAANKPDNPNEALPAGDTPLELSFPKDGRIASLIVRDAEGRQLDHYFSDHSGTLIKAYYMADSSKGQHVQVEVQEHLGVKPIVIPLTMKLGLAGEMEPEEKASSNK